MRHMICTKKVRDDSGIIIGYTLREIVPGGAEADYGVDYLVEAVRSGEIGITNLHLNAERNGFLPVGERLPESAPVQAPSPAESEKPAKKPAARKTRTTRRKGHKRRRR